MLFSRRLKQKSALLRWVAETQSPELAKAPAAECANVVISAASSALEFDHEGPAHGRRS